MVWQVKKKKWKISPFWEAGGRDKPLALSSPNALLVAGESGPYKERNTPIQIFLPWAERRRNQMEDIVQ